MGPVSRLLGNEVAPAQIWQDPVPDPQKLKLSNSQIAELKIEIIKSGADISSLVRAAWASASSYRMTDYRGGANGARVRLAPQKDWAANDPAELADTLGTLEVIQTKFNTKYKRRAQVSLADLIVLGGCVSVEEAAKRGGVSVSVPFTPGRTDATAEMTDADSFDVLEPKFDGVRNHFGAGPHRIPSAEEALLDKAHMLTLRYAYTRDASRAEIS